LYCPNPGMSAEYLVFQSIDLSQSGKTIDNMAVLGAEGTYYMSEKNIYVATETDAWRKTKISRYSYEKGTIQYACEKVINGTILNQFSMDEYEGNLRFAATTYDDNGKQVVNGLRQVWGQATYHYAWGGDHYWLYPIPYNETQMNPNMEQNPGWK